MAPKQGEKKDGSFPSQQPGKKISWRGGSKPTSRSGIMKPQPQQQHVLPKAPAPSLVSTVPLRTSDPEEEDLSSRHQTPEMPDDVSGEEPSSASEDADELKMVLKQQEGLRKYAATNQQCLWELQRLQVVEQQLRQKKSLKAQKKRPVQKGYMDARAQPFQPTQIQLGGNDPFANLSGSHGASGDAPKNVQAGVMNAEDDVFSANVPVHLGQSSFTDKLLATRTAHQGGGMNPPFGPTGTAPAAVANIGSMMNQPIMNQELLNILARQFGLTRGQAAQMPPPNQPLFPLPAQQQAQPPQRKWVKEPWTPLVPTSYPGIAMDEVRRLQGRPNDPVHYPIPTKRVKPLRSHEGTSVLKNGSPIQTIKVPVTPNINMRVAIGSRPGVLPQRHGLEPPSSRDPRPPIWTQLQSQRLRSGNVPGAEDENSGAETGDGTTLQAKMFMEIDSDRDVGSPETPAGNTSKITTNICSRCAFHRLECDGARSCSRCIQSHAECQDQRDLTSTADASAKAVTKAVPNAVGSVINPDIMEILSPHAPHACVKCVMTGRASSCDIDHQRGIECRACTSERAKGILTTSCVSLSANGREYVPNRHPNTRNLYMGVGKVIQFSCVGCTSVGDIQKCDVDPYIKIGCTACRTRGQLCVFTLDRRDPENSQVNMIVRPTYTGINPDPSQTLLRPWWRRSCGYCSKEPGVKCGWLYDYRRMKYKCYLCSKKNIPCVDAEGANREMTQVFIQPEPQARGYVPGVRMLEPRVVERARSGRTCIACFSVQPWMTASNRRKGVCQGWFGAEDFACLRCMALGIPCAVDEKDGSPPKMLPFSEPNLIGYGIGENASAMEFDACDRCKELNRWCDRMRPCHHCEKDGEDCEMKKIEAGFGLIPKANLEGGGIEAGPEYWMAMGYGGLGPDGPVYEHAEVDEFNAVGPPERLCWVVPQAKGQHQHEPREQYPEAQGQHQQQSQEWIPQDQYQQQLQQPPAAEGGSGMTWEFTPAPESLPNFSVDVDMSGYDHGFVGSTYSTHPSSPPESVLSPNEVPSSNSSDDSSSLCFNDLTQCFNTLKPPSRVFGTELAPFSTTVWDDLDHEGQYDEADVFGALQRFEDAEETKRIIEDIKMLCEPRIKGRFVETQLARHPDPNDTLPNEIPVPPPQRVLLTLEGQARGAQDMRPYASVEESAFSEKHFRHLLSRWRSPGINVLRDIPNIRMLYPIKGFGQCIGRNDKDISQRCPIGAPAAAVCENLQHKDYNYNLPITCDDCDENAVANLLLGAERITVADIFSLRTYACRDCVPRESRADGVVRDGNQRLMTGCTCASKLLRRRLCDSHRYTLASALFVNAALVKEWMLVNFKPDFCMFCKKNGKVTVPDDEGVFFCHNCQERVVDGTGHQKSLFRGTLNWEDGVVRPGGVVEVDEWGAHAVRQMIAMDRVE